ncbi:astakine-like [Bacillus rossius redtenbacheri]|uniref:astakine-like n=1 Tax=Bacillus rossius redtenbacheri TaxID=93214 RepID=UPI002FDCF232
MEKAVPFTYASTSAQPGLSSTMLRNYNMQATVALLAAGLVMTAGGAAGRHRGTTVRPHGEFECLSSAECGPDHCCTVRPDRYSYPSCQLLGQGGDTCRPSARPFNTSLAYPDGLVVSAQDVHYIMCACAPGLVCRRGVCSEHLAPTRSNSLED